MLAIFPLLSLLLIGCQVPADQTETSRSAERPRAREAGVTFGRFPTGKWNAITDVQGVRVGHETLIRGDSVRSGVTVVLPHGGNLFQEKVPAALVVGNGFGKLVGATQVRELGELESPIALTNTLSVHRVADALLGHMLALPGNESVRSINVVVGETNDGGLSDIRGRHVQAEHLRAALERAASGPVQEGSVGAGTGTRCLGWKGGIGTASRVIGEHTLGVLVQSNFGGRLRIEGRTLPTPRRREEPEEDALEEAGSCMILVATDAPLETRNLERLAKRALGGMARTGAAFSNGSGDYVLAFSTAEQLRIRPGQRTRKHLELLSNRSLSRHFTAVADATEEAILNSLFRATTVHSRFGHAEALPLEGIRR